MEAMQIENIRVPEISIAPVLDTPGPFTDAEYTSEFGHTAIEETKILVIGAGGLGCEILKDLALSGFKDIHVIDMDTIELSNLNRQFLFREGDVGRSKSEVAARFVMNRVKNVNITSYYNKIQDFDYDFYKQFTIVISGLDNIEARRWINKVLIELAISGVYIPMIDGGTEGFEGSVKVIIPTITACFECYLGLIPPQTTYPLCTMASTPRLPEHCIEWAHQLEWPKLYPDEKFDADSPDHLDKMYKMSLERAQKFNIGGVTKSKTLGVVKNIIPAIASTNAIIAGACCNEVFKFVTSCNPYLENTMYYNGKEGVQAFADPYHKKDDCDVCGNLPELIEIADKDITVDGFLELLKEEHGMEKLTSLFTSDQDILGKDGTTRLSEYVSITTTEEVVGIDSKLDKPKRFIVQWV